MPPLNEEKLNLIKDERKKQIMDAALNIFAKYGVEKTKMSMIANEANISNGLFYRYFKSKDDIFTTLINIAIESSLSSIDEIYNIDGSPLYKIEILTKIIIDKSTSPYFKLILQTHNSDNVPKAARDIIQNYPMKVYVNRLLPLFKEGQKNGEFIDGNLEELISSYLTILSGIMILDDDYTIPKVNTLLRIISNKI